ncbi:Uncharacterised protein [Streptococcus suis]|nr:Uncharacterised protein [Streptococcus suis]
MADLAGLPLSVALILWCHTLLIPLRTRLVDWFLSNSPSNLPSGVKAIPVFVTLFSLSIPINSTLAMLVLSWTGIPPVALSGTKSGAYSTTSLPLVLAPKTKIVLYVELPTVVLTPKSPKVGAGLLSVGTRTVSLDGVAVESSG